MPKEILINQLFAGGYLAEGENIGHEVINLFKDDDGNNNLFITPSGSVNGHDLEYILFVRNYANRRTVEVVGLAEEVHPISNEEMHQVRYAGVTLDKIFSSNKYHGGADIFDNHVTFRAEKLFIPAKTIYLSLDDEFISSEETVYINTEKKVIIPQGMRTYFSENDDNIAYNQLKKLISNKELWKENATEKLFPEGAVHNQSPSFLEVIRKEDDENIFSNLLSYFFEYSHKSFQRFAAEVLDIPNMELSFSVERETMERIDLWIQSDKDIIVIENKIKSGINGVKEDYSQLRKYREFAEANKDKKTVHYYVFAPNYTGIELSKYADGNCYTLISYSKIYDFFVRESATYIADRAFPDFLRGLKRHTLSLPELQFETMRSRLLRKINQLQ
jgi:hypothetical protein